MTTQNTHHEHSDMDASIVEHPPVPESMVASSTSETVTPDGAEVQASPSDEPATPTEIQAEVLQDTPEVLNASVLQSEEQSVTTEQGDPIQETYNPEIIPDVDPALITPIILPIEESVTVSHSDSVPLLERPGEEVRAFTDFIEEFRQAEEARLNVSRQEVQPETFTLLTTEGSAPITELPQTTDESLPSIEAGGSSSSSDVTPEEASSLPAFIAPIAQLSGEAPEEAPIVEQQVEVTKEQPATPVAPTERTVSPLLRPAARLRIPRHGISRHVREEMAAENASVASTPEPQAEQPAQLAPVEPVVESEQPRPARRYRFDRPAASLNGATGTNAAQPVQPAVSPQRTEEMRDKDIQNRVAAPLIQTDTLLDGKEQQVDSSITTTKSAANTSNTGVIAAQGADVQKQSAAQEATVTESIATPSTIEHNRRRPERHKEQQVAATPIADIVTSAPEPAPNEVAPEDLPPLEYSELQKASTRRRRRHRTSPSNGNGSPAPAIIETPAAPIAQPVQPAPAPIALPPVASPLVARSATPPAANGNPYSIVSGYTVSQMNQGNEVAGPFMGPEPSPARGSIVTRDGRTIRAEAQRSPTYSPTRTHEVGPTSTSLNHFANVLSQAIQTQTDRMVAELRHSSQAPTNVSVTLPPFPSTERVGVFVDVANLLYSARTLRIGVDFGKLLDFLRGNRRLIRAHAYCPTSPQAGDEQMFLQAVKGLGYRITTKNYKTFSSGAKKADLDLDLCMDVVRIVDGRAVDCIVLVSGDSDFMPMLDYCSDHGVRVEVAAFDEAMSATLRQSCDLFINLSMLEEIRS